VGRGASGVVIVGTALADTAGTVPHEPAGWVDAGVACSGTEGDHWSAKSSSTGDSSGSRDCSEGPRGCSVAGGAGGSVDDLRRSAGGSALRRRLRSRFKGASRPGPEPGVSPRV